MASFHGSGRSSQSPLRLQHVLLCLFLCCCPPASSLNIHNMGQPNNNFTLPSHITLRAGVLHAPPFAMVEELWDGSLRFGGFQPDLLQRLSVFAQQDDNVTLEFQLSRSPPQYGAALDLIARDCNSTHINENTLEDCRKFDLIVGDYYCNPARSLRIDFTPSWLRTTMSTVKFLGDKQGKTDYTTLTQASNDGQTVCVPDGTYLMGVVMEKFPQAQYYKCPSPEDCLQALKDNACVLYADDELLLRYRASLATDLEVTRETFNTQYLVWPMRFDLHPMVALYMKKWMYAAVSNATLDALYHYYFQKELCPVGTAGENCELPCDPNHGSANARGVCVCESNKWTGVDCSLEVPENTNMIPPTLKWIAYTMLGINLAVMVLCAIWLFWQKDSTQVRISQPFFLALVLVGCAVSSSTILAMAQEDDGQGSVPACMAIPWLYSVGFSITFGTLFAKIRRVYGIFKSAATPGTARKISVTFQETIAVIGLVLLVDVFVLIVWTLLSPLEWTRTVISADQFGAPLESEGYCHSEDWLIFGGIIAALHLALMGTACYLCYVARNIPSKFSESKYLSIAMISNLQIFVVGVPILVIIGSNPQTSFFVRSVIIWMNDLAVVLLIFGNLIYNAHFHLEAAEPEAVKAAIGQAIQSFSTTRESRRISRLSSQFTSTTAYSPGVNSSFQGSGQVSMNGSAHLFTNNQPTQILQQSDREKDPKRRSTNKNSSISSAKEITLTKSELEESNSSSLRRGEPQRRLQDSRHSDSGQNTPLSRSFLNSSVSTQMHSNIPEIYHGRAAVANLSRTSQHSLPDTNSVNSWANANLSSNLASVSRASTHSRPPSATPECDEEDEDEDEEERTTNYIPGLSAKPPFDKPVDVMGGDRESWGGINVSNLSSSPDDNEDADEEQGGASGRMHDESKKSMKDESKKSMKDESRQSMLSTVSTRSRLPPSSLPQVDNDHLSYAAARIRNIRGVQEQAVKAREGSLQDSSYSTHGTSTDDTGNESFHDESDNMNGSAAGRRSRRSPRRPTSSPEKKMHSSYSGPSLQRSSSSSSAASDKQRNRGTLPPRQNSSSAAPDRRRRQSTSKRRRSSRGGQQYSPHVEAAKKSSALGWSQIDVSEKELYFS